MIKSIAGSEMGPLSPPRPFTESQINVPLEKNSPRVLIKRKILLPFDILGPAPVQ